MPDLPTSAEVEEWREHQERFGPGHETAAFVQAFSRTERGGWYAYQASVCLRTF